MPQKDKMVELSVKDIRPGMRVDLLSCPHLNDYSSAEFEFGAVEYCQQETDYCLALGYTGIDVIGYVLNQKLAVRELCYNCFNCDKEVNITDNLAMDGTGFEHARENELCLDCTILDDVTHDIANGNNNYQAVVYQTGKIEVTVGERIFEVIISRKTG
jgi:hypothetical protein